MKTLTIQLPDEVYTRLQHAAHGNEQRLRQVAVQMLSTVFLSDNMLPQDLQQELRLLESLSDDLLWAVARSKIAASKQRRWKRLLDKQQQRALTMSEQQELEQYVAESDRLTLYKANAYLILQKRGQRIPELERLQKSR